MAVFIPLEEMEKAHAAYNECSEQLAQALEEVKARGGGTKEQLDKIAAINKKCDELMHSYMDAFKKYYGLDDRKMN